jgi:hypothetical protein
MSEAEQRRLEREKRQRQLRQQQRDAEIEKLRAAVSAGGSGDKSQGGGDSRRASEIASPATGLPLRQSGKTARCATAGEAHGRGPD